MTHIFDELLTDWHHVEQRVTEHLHHQPATITANAPQSPQEGPTMSLSTIASDMKTAIEDGETRIRTVLDEHLPQLLELAQKVENDPLIQAAEAAALPPGARNVVAEMITKLAETFPQETTPAAIPVPDPSDPAHAGPVVGGQA